MPRSDSIDDLRNPGLTICQISKPRHNAIGMPNQETVQKGKKGEKKRGGNGDFLISGGWRVVKKKVWSDIELHSFYVTIKPEIMTSFKAKL